MEREPTMRKQRKSTPLMYALVILFTAWMINSALAVNGNIDAAKQAWPMIESGALVIDVRSKQEFDRGHLDGAINIDWDDTEALMTAIGSDKQRQVVFYCRTGNRVGKSIVVLKSEGYTNIFNATGLDALNATKP